MEAVLAYVLFMISLWLLFLGMDAGKHTFKSIGILFGLRFLFGGSYGTACVFLFTDFHIRILMFVFCVVICEFVLRSCKLLKIDYERLERRKEEARDRRELDALYDKVYTEYCAKKKQV